jgi:hypothetical protein
MRYSLSFLCASLLSCYNEHCYTVTLLRLPRSSRGSSPNHAQNMWRESKTTSQVQALQVSNRLEFQSGLLLLEQPLGTVLNLLHHGDGPVTKCCIRLELDQVSPEAFAEKVRVAPLDKNGGRSHILLLENP